MKTGLILEGGGMRGVFTAGVLDFFIDNNVEFDICIGVSAGACHACSYLAGQRGRAYAVTTDYLDDKRYCSFSSLIKTGDMFGAEMLYKLIPEQLYPIDNEAFKKQKTEFYAAATDCITGNARYFRINDLIKDVDCIRASSSLPLISNIVELDGRPYLDGGIVDAIPITQAIRCGCDKAIVVLTRPHGYVKKKESLLRLIQFKYRRYPKLVKAVVNRHNMYNNTVEMIERYEEKGRVLVIRPDSELNIGRTEKDKGKLKYAYDKGYETCRKRYNDIKMYLEK